MGRSFTAAFRSSPPDPSPPDSCFPMHTTLVRPAAGSSESPHSPGGCSTDQHSQPRHRRWSRTFCHCRPTPPPLQCSRSCHQLLLRQLSPGSSRSRCSASSCSCAASLHLAAGSHESRRCASCAASSTCFDTESSVCPCTSRRTSFSSCTCTRTRTCTCTSPAEVQVSRSSSRAG